MHMHACRKGKIKDDIETQTIENSGPCISENEMEALGVGLYHRLQAGEENKRHNKLG